MRRTAATAVLFAALLAARASAAGEPAADDRPGRALFERAEAKFNVGRFDEALVDYQAAYDAEPLPAFLFNIGQCYRNMGNYERAQFFFRRYTALDPRSPNRPAAERLIAEMDRLAGERGAPPEEVALTSPLPSVAAPVPPNESRPPAAPTGASIATKTENNGPRPPVYRRAWFWVAVSAVVVAGGAAAALAIRQDDPRSSLRPIDGCTPAKEVVYTTAWHLTLLVAPPRSRGIAWPPVSGGSSAS